VVKFWALPIPVRWRIEEIESNSEQSRKTEAK
jgi:hypothetical protein